MALYRFAPPAQVARLQAKYVRLFAEVGARKVLDLGCGRGIFLKRLREVGIKGIGIDNSPDAVRQCRAEGLEVHEEEALAALRRLVAAGELLNGIFCSHLIEHLQGDAPQALITLCAAALAPGGRLVVVTPNTENLQVLTEGFWLDLHHVRPMPRSLIETLMREVGLSVVRTGTDLEAIPRWQEAPWWRKMAWRVVLGQNIVSRHLLSGLDSYVVGERGGGAGP